MFEFGKIILMPFPFTDLSSAKVRPALILSKNNTKNNDIIVAFITSQETIKGLNISNKDTVFKKSGLKINSVIRFDKLATLNKKIVLGELGYLPKKFLQKNKKIFEGNFGFY